MEKVYKLEGLDCPNCALKIEKAIGKLEEVKQTSISFATLRCEVEYETYNEEVEQKVINKIEEMEDVHVIKMDDVKKGHHENHDENLVSEEHHHDHEHCGCEEHHHDHEHCGCEEHHHDHEHCGCEEHHHDHEHCGCEEHHHDHEHCGCEEHHHDHEHCGCEEHHHDHEHCGCEEHHHDHEHCGCEEHHHDHEHCGCEEHHHDHEHCGCEEHHHDHEHCGCEEHHHDHEHCGCEEHHHDHEHCGCEEHHHDHEHGCSCGHDHNHEHKERSQASTTSTKVKWNINGLDCAHCALKVEDAVNEVDGVETATLNFTTKTLIFYIKKNENVNKIKENVKTAILNVEEVVIVEGNEPQEKKQNKKYLGIWIGTPLLIIGSIMNNSIIMILAYFMIGSQVILKALKNIKRKEIFDENFLMVIATLGAIVVGEYLEAVAVMLFYQIGEYFQDRAVEKSRKSIADLMDIKVDVAHLLVNGKSKDVSPEDIKVDDVILIQPGERVALDGNVVKGNSSLDTSALTGESLPKEVSISDEVLAGCINLNGVLEVKVTKEASESTVSRILDLVENASSKKAKTELKMTRFARVYTPIVVGMAVILAVVPNFFNTGVNWQEWLIRACTFLVISCPCALVLSIPLGYFAGIGSASKKGILVKGGNYLEILSEVDTIVFDKTGTLTNGSFTVTNVYSNDSEKCLELAAMAESYSSHPIATSIIQAYNQTINKDVIKNVKEIAGQGISCEINGQQIFVGNKKLMIENNIQIEEIDSIGTLVYVASNQEFVGMIEISDTLKENTKLSLAQLKQTGVSKLVMLTGDREKTAHVIANEAGIDEVHSELLPTDKVEEFEKILASSRGKVAYVGDGINDAPVLARSDIGIAMGGLGSEAAVEASDIVLMKDDLSALPKGIKLARFTQKIMNQNIAFILLVKLGILGLSLFGMANMWMGVFADVGVSVLAVINSMRILQK